MCRGCSPRTSHSPSRTGAASPLKSPRSRIASAAATIPLRATHVRLPPTLTRRAPASTSCAIVTPGTASTFTGFATASRTALTSSTLRNPGGSRGRLLRPARRPGAARSCPRDRDFPRMWFSARAVNVKGKSWRLASSTAAATRSSAWPRLVEAPRRVVVLDRATHGAGLGGSAHRPSGIFRLRAVAVLEVDRHRQARRIVEGTGVLGDLVEVAAHVESAQREGQAEPCWRAP